MASSGTSAAMSPAYSLVEMLLHQYGRHIEQMCHKSQQIEYANQSLQNQNEGLRRHIVELNACETFRQGLIDQQTEIIRALETELALRPCAAIVEDLSQNTHNPSTPTTMPAHEAERRQVKTTIASNPAEVPNKVKGSKRQKTQADSEDVPK